MFGFYNMLHMVLEIWVCVCVLLITPDILYFLPYEQTAI